MLLEQLRMAAKAQQDEPLTFDAIKEKQIRLYVALTIGLIPAPEGIIPAANWKWGSRNKEAQKLVNLLDSST